MYTHQMHQVEELCDRIVLIDNGRNVLYGNLAEIRHRFSGHAVLVRSTEELPSLQGIEQIAVHNGDIKLSLTADTTPKNILRQFTDQEIDLEKFEIAIPSLDEIFIQVVEEGRAMA